MAGGFVPGSARANSDAILHFDPLPVANEPMPILRRPMIMPRVLGRSQQQDENSQQALVPRIIRNSRTTVASSGLTQQASRLNLESEEEVNVTF